MENNQTPDEQTPSRVQKYHKKISHTEIPAENPAPAEAPVQTPPPLEEPPKKSKPHTEKTKKMPGAASWIVTILLAVVIALALRIFVFEIVLVDGDSMLPTLNSEQRVVVEKVTRYFHLPQKGDIVITKYPNMPGYYVKRMIAYSGDTVEIKANTVYVNDAVLVENYISTDETYADMDKVTVPEGFVFVMGDNRSKSLDSRSESVGPVPINDLIGNGVLIIWPFDQIHMIS